MIVLADFLKAIDYKIVDGGPFLWTAFGQHAWVLSYDNDDVSASIVFDTQTRNVYMAEIIDLNNSANSIVRFNKCTRDQYFAEVQNRAIDAFAYADGSGDLQYFNEVHDDASFLNTLTLLLS